MFDICEVQKHILTHSFNKQNEVRYNFKWGQERKRKKREQGKGQEV